MLRFVERQTVFVLETTADVKTYHDFLTNMSGMVLFNSTCMCLQTIGETIRQVDELTAGNLFARYLLKLNKQQPQLQILWMLIALQLKL